jgi:CRP/FNR family cyclic AMP-dependent transcriptional regulator
VHLFDRYFTYPPEILEPLMAFKDIETLALFEGCSRRDMRKIRSICTPISMAEGRELTRLGAHGRECMLIEAGTVQVLRDGEVIAEVGPGELIGEMALLDGPSGERTATTIAATDCETLVFSPAEFNQLMRAFPVIGERIQRIAEARLASALV